LVAQGKLTIPVLSISGKASFGDFQKGFVEAFAGNLVKHATIDGAGRFVAEEQPEALMNELRPFLAR
jgi:pimeloyl-ACP methyl ester carboxylesterase